MQQMQREYLYVIICDAEISRDDTIVEKFIETTYDVDWSISNRPWQACGNKTSWSVERCKNDTRIYHLMIEFHSLVTDRLKISSARTFGSHKNEKHTHIARVDVSTSILEAMI